MPLISPPLATTFDAFSRPLPPAIPLLRDTSYARDNLGREFPARRE